MIRPRTPAGSTSTMKIGKMRSDFSAYSVAAVPDNGCCV
jgi:hypothetical protein